MAFIPRLRYTLPASLHCGLFVNDTSLQYLFNEHQCEVFFTVIMRAGHAQHFAEAENTEAGIVRHTHGSNLLPSRLIPRTSSSTRTGPRRAPEPLHLRGGSLRFPSPPRLSPGLLAAPRRGSAQTLPSGGVPSRALPAEPTRTPPLRPVPR